MLLRVPRIRLVAMQRAQRRSRLLNSRKRRVLAASGGPVGGQREMVKVVAAAMPLLLLVAVRMRRMPQVSQASIVAGAHAAAAGAGGTAGRVAGPGAVQQACVNLKWLPLWHAAQHVQQLGGGARSRRRSRRRLDRRAQRRGRRPVRRAWLLLGGGAGAAHPPWLVLGWQLRRTVEHIFTEAQVRLDLQGRREVGGRRQRRQRRAAASLRATARFVGAMGPACPPVQACWRRPWPRRGAQAAGSTAC